MQEVRDTIAGRGVKFLLIVDDYHVVSSQYVDTRAYTEKIGGGGGGAKFKVQIMNIWLLGYQA